MGEFILGLAIGGVIATLISSFMYYVVFPKDKQHKGEFGGKWIRVFDNADVFACNNCGATVEHPTKYCKYCPNCGSRNVIEE